jgi:N-acetyl-anhydromuramyl-L-alanine amidase AmpD
MVEWCPFAAARESPNITRGRAGQYVKAVVLHIAEGGYAGSVSWLTSAASGVSAHFMISKAGDITQMVHLSDTAYANGLSWNGSHWIDPEGTPVSPSWSGLTPPVNPNFQTVSIEHEGHSGDPWTPAMIAADVKLLRWLKQQLGFAFVPHETLIGHFEISPIDRARCPGPTCPFTALAAAANGTPTPVPAVDYAAEWGTAAPYNADWGIPTKWRLEYQSGHPLGPALGPEMDNESPYVIQQFQKGWIWYLKNTGSVGVLR